LTSVSWRRNSMMASEPPGFSPAPSFETSFVIGFSAGMVCALAGNLTRGDRTDFILFPAGSKIDSAIAMKAGNTHKVDWLQIARPIVADAGPGVVWPGLSQALPWRDNPIGLVRDLDPIDTCARDVLHRGRKTQKLDCSQTCAAYCQYLEWSWRQITWHKLREARRKTGSSREMAMVPAGEYPLVYSGGMYGRSHTENASGSGIEPLCATLQAKARVK
jgi:hypothetical protein